MAWQNYYDAIAGVGKAVTWGTAIDLTTATVGNRCHFSSISPSISIEKFFSNDNAASGRYVQAVKDLGFTCGFTISGELSFGQSWQYFFANLMGADTVGAETTAGQGDYPHKYELESDAYAKLLTFAYSVEDDKTIEFPSVKCVGFQFEQSANATGKWTATCIADRAVYTGTVNTYAKLAALTMPNTFENAYLAGTNAYCRIADWSSSTTMTNTSDRKILSWSLKLDRPLESRRCLQGANTRYIVQPRQLGRVTGEFTVTLNERLASDIDVLLEYMTSNKEKFAEIMQDGAAIGTGVNTSLKIQLASLKYTADTPGGYGWEGASIPSPVLKFQLCQPTAAPAGMATLTKPLRVTSIDHRVTAYV